MMNSNCFSASNVAIVLLFLAANFASAESNWINLFDGETLFGWQATTDTDWSVVDGEIRATSGEPGFLLTTTRFADYELELEFKATTNTNSGVFLRTTEAPTKPNSDCYELNIAPPDNPFPTGSLVARKRSTATAPTTDDWHNFHVTALGPRLTVKLDGQAVCDYTDDAPIKIGHIGLQFREGPIAFRNIRLRPLGCQPIFNGRDLTGWNTDKAEESRFEVTSRGELRVLDGRGQIESNGKFANFVLQLDCFVGGDGLNSGIFFRCIPGDFMNGYESQIHNGIEEGDPTRPVDCGTGGIFRRQNARRIVARDREWFTKTIIADGPHVATWVNGTQVCDWTDAREPHENPRKGLRLEAGTICIQGHDPTTDLRFRNLKIANLPAD